MSTYEYDTTLELTEKVFVEGTIFYEVENGSKGDYWEPGVGDEVYVEEVDFDYLYGDNWSKSYAELRDAGWLTFLFRTEAWARMVNHVENDDLGKLIHNARYNYARD